MSDQPIESYFLCATPRSGSTLLCDLLRRSGVAGAPESFFRDESIPYWSRELKLDAAAEHAPVIDRAYLTAVRQVGSSANGLFGARIMGESLPPLLKRLARLFPDHASDRARLEAAFGRARYIYLTREDKLGQAASLAKALQSGLWHRHADGSELERTAPQHPSQGYDPALMERCYRETCADDQVWRDWFQSQDIAPLRITYEQLAQDPRAACVSVLGALGQDPALAAALTPGTAKLADRETQDWIARYRADRGLG